jgi:hypothetical protein
MAAKRKATKRRLREALQPPAFVNIFELSELTNIPVRSYRTLIVKRSIPFIKVGHRTLLFSVPKVLAALESFEVQPITPRNGRRRK